MVFGSRSRRTKYETSRRSTSPNLNDSLTTTRARPHRKPVRTGGTGVWRRRLGSVTTAVRAVTAKGRPAAEVIDRAPTLSR